MPPSRIQETDRKKTNGNGLAARGQVHHETMLFACSLAATGVKVTSTKGDALDIDGIGHFNAHLLIDYTTNRVTATIYERRQAKEVWTAEVRTPAALRALFREWLISSH